MNCSWHNNNLLSLKYPRKLVNNIYLLYILCCMLYNGRHGQIEFRLHYSLIGTPSIQFEYCDECQVSRVLTKTELSYRSIGH